jgi:hypothetical protein
MVVRMGKFDIVRQECFGERRKMKAVSYKIWRQVSRFPSGPSFLGWQRLGPTTALEQVCQALSGVWASRSVRSASARWGSTQRAVAFSGGHVEARSWAYFATRWSSKKRDRQDPGRVNLVLMKTRIFLLPAIGLFLCQSLSQAASIDLGAAGNYAVLGLDGATTNLSSGPLRINGNVGAADNSQLNFSGGGAINGRVDYSSSSSLNTGGNTITGGTHEINFSPVEQAVQNLVNYANSLSSTQAFSSITSPMTLTSTGPQNVIAIAHDIHLSGGNLTLNGSASDVFIFQISGTMELSGNTNIVLTGGLTPNNVLWDFIGFGSQFQTSGQSDTAGIFLAPDRDININGGIHNSEFISGTRLSFQSNPVVNQVPEASTVSLLILGMIVGGLTLRRRLSAS